LLSTLHPPIVFGSTLSSTFHVYPATIEKLGLLAEWCRTQIGSGDQAAAGPLHRGPEPPYFLRWSDGEKTWKIQIGNGPGNRSWKLLEYFWTRDTASYTELQGEGKPWENPVTDSGISSAVNRFNNEPWPPDFPWRLRVAKGNVLKVPR
jgi:hypothetical protein